MTASMTKYNLLRGKILLLGAVALVSMTSVALAATDSNGGLTPQQQGDVTYITGGIGTDERDQLEAAKSDYNLHITNSVNGAFSDNNTLSITNSKGAEVLSTEAGPLLYAQLPAGTYKLTATHRDHEQTKTVKLGKTKSANIDFAWK